MLPLWATLAGYFSLGLDLSTPFSN